jgi:hypothetical protein
VGLAAIIAASALLFSLIKYARAVSRWQGKVVGAI